MCLFNLIAVSKFNKEKKFQRSRFTIFRWSYFNILKAVQFYCITLALILFSNSIYSQVFVGNGASIFFNDKTVFTDKKESFIFKSANQSAVTVLNNSFIYVKETVEKENAADALVSSDSKERRNQKSKTEEDSKSSQTKAKVENFSKFILSKSKGRSFPYFTDYINVAISNISVSYKNLIASQITELSKSVKFKSLETKALEFNTIPYCSTDKYLFRFSRPPPSPLI